MLKASHLLEGPSLSLWICGGEASAYLVIPKSGMEMGLFIAKPLGTHLTLDSTGLQHI